MLTLANALAAERPGWLLPSALAYLVGSTFVGFGLSVSYPHSRLGLCNIATQMRLAMTAALVVPVAIPTLMQDDATVWRVLALAVVILSLDGADGALARRSGLVSRFGARFDMEVDAALAMALSLILLRQGEVGPLVLALGIPRYAFALTGQLLPWLRAPLPESLRRKAICVIQIGALIVMTAPVVSGGAAHAITVAVSALVIWSFAIDIVWLFRRRP